MYAQNNRKEKPNYSYRLTTFHFLFYFLHAKVYSIQYSVILRLVYVYIVLFKQMYLIESHNKQKRNKNNKRKLNTSSNPYNV